MGLNNLLYFAQQMEKLIRPKEILSIAQWSKKYLRLPTSSSSEGGPLDIATRTPYLVQPLEDFINPDIRRIVLMTSTQVGKTMSLLAAMLYQVFNNPGPMMLVLPSKSYAMSFNKKRIKPLIRHSPEIKKLFTGNKDKSTLITLLFKGGFLSLAGSSVAADLSSDAICDLLLDEVDRYEENVGGEGSPISVVRSRLATYSHKSTEFMSSTPILDTGNIYQNYLLGDQRKYLVPCLHCNEFQELVFEQLKWDAPEDVWYECKHCAGRIEHRSHAEILQKGKWESQDTALTSSIRSYHISVLYSPFYSWRNTVQDYLEARGDAIKERTFRNSRLGLPYAEHEIVQNHKDLYARREDYRLGDTLNDNIVVLVCAFDIQESWVKGIVYGVGEGFEMWCVDVIDIRGRFEDPELTNKLAKTFDRTYTTKDGRVLSISCTAIDVSFNLATVYDWIKKEQRYDDSKVKAIRGSSVKNSTKTIGYPKRKSEKQIYTLDTDRFKENFYSRLKIERNEGVTPSYIHFPEMEEREFMELCAESKMMTVNKNTKKQEYRWVVTARDGRNENLDTTVYCLALIHILYRKWEDEDFEHQKLHDLRQMKILKSDERKVGDNTRAKRDNRRGASDKSKHSDNFGDAYDWD